MPSTRPLSPSRALLLGTALLACACASASSRAGQDTTPARHDTTEIVVDEATVVTATPAPSESRGHVVELPAWPSPIESYSVAFQCAAQVIAALLHAPEAPRITYPEACARWSGDNIASWPRERGPAFMLALGAMQSALQGGGPERDLGVALSALSLDSLLPLQLVDPEPPADAKLDAGQRTAYVTQTSERNGALLHGATYSLHACSGSRDPAIAAWRALCDRAGKELQAAIDSDPRLVQALAAQREQLALSAAGERPEGPAACWAPSVTPELATTPAAPAPAPTDAAASPAAGPTLALAGAKRCALAAGAVLALAAPFHAAPSLEEQFAGPFPRDHRFGPRDANSGVRVSIALQGAPALDARPLLTESLHTALAQCLAAEPVDPAAPPATFALEAALVVSPKGVAKASAPKNVQDAEHPAAPASKTLLACVRTALSAVAFDCTADKRPAKLRATLCLRRD